MVVNRLKWYLEYYNQVFAAADEDHIMRLHDTVRKSLANEDHVLAVFIYVEKAYDTVCTEALLLKQLRVSINEKKNWFHSVITSYKSKFTSSFWLHYIGSNTL